MSETAYRFESCHGHVCTGAVAQSGERCNGIAEVGGSIPPGSIRKGGLRDGADRLIVNVAGWSGLVARRAHNPKVAGSNPAPAINGEGKGTPPLAAFPR